MSVPPVPPAPDGARFDRAIDSLEFHNQRLERLRAIFPSFKKIYVGMLELIAANTGDLAAEKREVVAAKPAPELQAKSNGRAEAHAKSNGHGPSNDANSKHDRDQRFASDRLEAGDPLDPDDGETCRPVSPHPRSKAANGHKPAEA